MAEKKPSLLDFTGWVEKEGHKHVVDPKSIQASAIKHDVLWSKFTGSKETEGEMRERLYAHWPSACRADIDAAVERQFHPERRN